MRKVLLSFPLKPPKPESSLRGIRRLRLRLASLGGIGGLTGLLLRLRRHRCPLATRRRRHNRRMSVVAASTTISNFACVLARQSQAQAEALELDRHPAADAELDSQASPPHRSSLAFPPGRCLPLRMPDRAGVPRPPTVSNGPGGGSLRYLPEEPKPKPARRSVSSPAPGLGRGMG